MWVIISESVCGGKFRERFIRNKFGIFRNSPNQRGLVAQIKLAGEFMEKGVGT